MESCDQDLAKQELFGWLAPSDIQLIVLFCSGSKVERVNVSRLRVEEGAVDVQEVVKEHCDPAGTYKHTSVAMLAHEGLKGPVAVRRVAANKILDWPKTIRAIAPLDALIVINRRQPRVCLTRRNLLAKARRRRTRRINSALPN